MIFRNAQGKKIGELIGDTYYTYRTEEHFMRKFQGFGVSEEILNILSNNNCSHIQIKYNINSNIKIFNSELKQWLESYKKFNYNGDNQNFLSLIEMSEE